MTAATHVRVLCTRYCNGLIEYILLHYFMKFHLEITKDKEMTTFFIRTFRSPHVFYILDQNIDFWYICTHVGY